MTKRFLFLFLGIIMLLEAHSKKNKKKEKI